MKFLLKVSQKFRFVANTFIYYEFIKTSPINDDSFAATCPE